eukprot:4027700-Pleurochrysis_carterae.AAC.7
MPRPVAPSVAQPPSSLYTITSVEEISWDRPDQQLVATNGFSAPFQEDGRNVTAGRPTGKSLLDSREDTLNYLEKLLDDVGDNMAGWDANGVFAAGAPRAQRTAPNSTGRCNHAVQADWS